MILFISLFSLLIYFVHGLNCIQVNFLLFLHFYKFHIASYCNFEWIIKWRKDFHPISQKKKKKKVKSRHENSIISSSGPRNMNRLVGLSQWTKIIHWLATNLLSIFILRISCFGQKYKLSIRMLVVNPFKQIKRYTKGRGRMLFFVTSHMIIEKEII